MSQEETTEEEITPEELKDLTFGMRMAADQFEMNFDGRRWGQPDDGEPQRKLIAALLRAYADGIEAYEAALASGDTSSDLSAWVVTPKNIDELPVEECEDLAFAMDDALAHSTSVPDAVMTRLIASILRHFADKQRSETATADPVLRDQSRLD